MAVIDKYIKEFVHNNRRVIIPDLGAFLLKDSGNEGNKTIIFSSFLRYNDGFLEEVLAQKANLDKASASVAVKKFTEEITRAMRNKKRYEIPDFGYFALDDKGTIQFIAYKDIVEPIVDKGKINIENQSVSSAVRAAAEAIQQPLNNSSATTVNTVNVEAEAQQPVQPPIANPTTTNNTSNNVSTQNQQVNNTVKAIVEADDKAAKKRSRLLWVIIFLLIIIVFLLTLLYLCATNSDLCFFRKKMGGYVEFQKAVSSMSTNNTQTLPPPATIDSSKMLQSPSSMVNTQGLNYYVIAGCFSEKINAERFLQRLLEQGYTSAELLPKIGELYPVSIAKSLNMNEAEYIRIHYNNKYDEEAWLYRAD